MDEPARLLGLTRVVVDGLGWRGLRSIELHGRVPVLRIEGVEHVDEAAALRGAPVRADAAEMPLEEGVYYYADLIGRPVVSPAGEPLGKVVDVMDSGAQDLLVVERDDRRYLVPLQADYVRVHEAEVEIDPIPGLLDLEG